jgi:hypothetical protein
MELLVQQEHEILVKWCIRLSNTDRKCIKDVRYKVSLSGAGIRPKAEMLRNSPKCTFVKWGLFKLLTSI